MSKTRLEKNLPAYWKQAYFLGKPAQIERDWSNTRLLGKKELSSLALLKLEWIIFYNTVGNKSATDTATHFGITRKTFHKWFSRFKKDDLLGLEEVSRRPQKTRKRNISLLQRIRIKKLRTIYPKYGKMKLVSIYQKHYQEVISSWKIQKIIEEGNLYQDKVAIVKLRRKYVQARIHKRQRITKLVRENKVNYLWHVDTVVLTLSQGGYRYLVTAIDEISKLAFARLYTTHTSRNAKDFLQRLLYLTDKKVMNLHHDNGSEFKKEFEEACCQLSIPQWYSRPHTPKDNAVLERFNRTIQEEFIEQTDYDIAFVNEFNNELTEWLIEYNFNRPHKTLDYRTPIQYLDEYYTKVSPMSSSPTSY